jgi:pSer/pThr/pTyr-binding forkhead associated (FHA) protein
MITECPNCQTPVASVDQQFCYQCGSQLKGEPESAHAGTQSGMTEALGIEPAALKGRISITLPTGDTFEREVASRETRLGKGPRNDIVIADPAVSTFHAVIEANLGVFTINDAGSRNGTYVGGERLVEPRRLRNGDVISIGRSRLTFRLVGAETEAINSRASASQGSAQPAISERLLAEAVVAAGLVDRADMDRARAADGGRRLYDALVKEGLVSQDTLRDLISRRFGIPTIDLSAATISDNLIAEVPATLLLEERMLPVSVENGKLLLAVSDPTSDAAISSIAARFKHPVELRLSTADEIEARIARIYAPKLVGVLPTGEKLEYQLGQSEIKIGKAAHNDIVLADPTVSNSHAVVLPIDSGYSIVDLDSRNGTFVGGERLGSQARPLEHGDTIQLGKTLLVFRSSSQTGENITTTLPDEALVDVRAGAAQENIAADDGDQPHGESAEKKKKKKKKKKDADRIRAAYVGAISRVVAQVLAVALMVGLAVYLNDLRSGSTQPPGTIDVPGKNDVVSRLTRPGDWVPLKGGKHEASGVIHVPGADGTVLFVDDGRTSEVLLIRLDAEGNQISPIKPIPLGINVDDPEGITYGGGYFYVVGSHSNQASGERNGLARFVFDSNSESIGRPPEVLRGLREYLISNLPELGTEINIEGIAWDPDHERLLLGLRYPVIANQAIIIPLKLNDPHGPFSVSNLTKPVAIRLALGGLGIRDIHYDSRLKTFLIIGGSTEHNERVDFKLWGWTGDPNQSGGDAVQAQEIAFDRQMKPEGIGHVTAGGSEFIFVIGDSSNYLKLDYSTGQRSGG